MSELHVVVPSHVVVAVVPSHVVVPGNVVVAVVPSHVVMVSPVAVVMPGRVMVMAAGMVTGRVAVGCVMRAVVSPMRAVATYDVAMVPRRPVPRGAPGSRGRRRSTFDRRPARLGDASFDDVGGSRRGRQARDRGGHDVVR